MTVMDMLDARGLDVELASRLGLNGAPGGGEVLQIDFRRGDDVVRRKFKRMGEVPEGAPRYWQEPKGGTKIAWNEDALKDQSLSGPLVITEGEIDAATAIQCGFLRTISVPDGAPPPGERSAEDLEASAKYDWLRDLKPFLSREAVPEVILATDGDENGAALLQDLSIQLGRFRVQVRDLSQGPRPRGTRPATSERPERGASGLWSEGRHRDPEPRAMDQG